MTVEPAAEEHRHVVPGDDLDAATLESRVERFAALVGERADGDPLRETRHLLALATRATQLGWVVWDLRTGVTSWDARGREIIGLAAGDDTVAAWRARIHPDDRPAVEAHLERCVAESRPFDLEYRVVHPDGTVRHVHGCGTFQHDDDPGRPVRATGLVRDITHRKSVETAAREGSERMRRHAMQLQALAAAALDVTAAPSLEAKLDLVARAARRVVGAHAAVVSSTRGPDWSQAITAISMSEAYEPWRDYAEMPDGTGIYAMVCEENRPVRMTQAELEAHPRYRGFGRHAAAHPPLRGWLAAPLVARDGTNLGLIQLSDKEDGAEFDDSDEAILIQLAHLASAAIEQSHAEEALREREARYRALFSSIDEGYCLGEMILDDEGRPASYRFLEVNHLFEKMTGLVDPVGKDVYELVPNLEPHWVEIYGRVALGGEPIRFENGSEAMGRWFDVFAAPVEPRGRFALVFKDITERRRAEAALRESESRFRATFENAAVGVAHVGVDGRWLRVNDRLCEIVGYPRPELLALTFQDITHPDDLDLDLRQVQRVLDGVRTTYSIEKRYVRQDGSTVWVDLTVSLVRTAAGEPDYFIAVVEDISERKQAEARLRTALTAKDEFLGLVSHELRTPMTVILGMSEILSRGGLSAERTAEVAADIADSAEVLNGLVESMLLLARLDRDEAAQLREPVLLHRAAGQVLERQQARDASRAYRLDIASYGTLVDVQPTWVERVIENLVVNAAKYSEPGRPVVVAVERSDHEVTLRVLDEGAALTDDQLDRLFEPFYRAPEAQRLASGAGLGLAVSRRIVELLGGRIWASRRPTGGAEFGFCLPAASDGDD